MAPEFKKRLESFAIKLFNVEKGWGLEIIYCIEVGKARYQLFQGLAKIYVNPKVIELCLAIEILSCS